MKLLKYLFIISYCLVVTYIVFFARRRRYLSERFLNVTPIKYKLIELARMSPNFDKEWYNFYLNLFGNIALFIPLPVILFLIMGESKFHKLIAVSFCISLLIEIAQYTFKVGVSDIDDILLNTAGAFIGAALLKSRSRINAHV